MFLWIAWAQLIHAGLCWSNSAALSHPPAGTCARQACFFHGVDIRVGGIRVRGEVETHEAAQVLTLELAHHHIHLILLAKARHMTECKFKIREMRSAPLSGKH